MIVNWLARRPWGQKVLVPVVIWCGFTSWWSYQPLIGGGTSNEQDAGRLKYWWGWTSPAMRDPWARVGDRDHPDYGSAYHSLKNVGSEYFRAFAQTAFKSFSFMLVATLLLAVIAASLAVLL